jgi:hypothetical protein
MPCRHYMIYVYCVYLFYILYRLNRAFSVSKKILSGQILISIIVKSLSIDRNSSQPTSALLTAGGWGQKGGVCYTLPKLILHIAGVDAAAYSRVAPSSQFFHPIVFISLTKLCSSHKLQYSLSATSTPSLTRQFPLYSHYSLIFLVCLWRIGALLYLFSFDSPWSQLATWSTWPHGPPCLNS